MSCWERMKIIEESKKENAEILKMIREAPKTEQQILLYFWTYLKVIKEWD